MATYLFIKANEVYPWGGSELLWSQTAQKLVDAGNKVCVSARDWGQPVPQIEKLWRAGCEIFLIDYKMPPFLTRQMRRLRGTYELDAFRLAHLRKAARGVDLIVISQGENKDGLPWMEAAQALGLKYVLIAHSATVYWWPSDDVAELVAKGYDHAAASYFVSQAVLELSRRQFGSSLPNSKVVRNPFNVPYDANPPWPKQSLDELALACVGRLDLIPKAQDVLLQVLALPHWRERDVRVSIVGSGPHERGLRRMAESANLANITFLGQRDDLEEIWSRHHALVLPSRFEGMPLALVEAMLCGRPGIVTDVGGNRELVRDGVDGFVAKAATVEFLDEALNRAWHCRARLQEMGCTAARDVREWVSPDPAADFAKELATLVANAGGQQPTA